MSEQEKEENLEAVKEVEATEAAAPAEEPKQEEAKVEEAKAEEPTPKATEAKAEPAKEAPKSEVTEKKEAAKPAERSDSRPARGGRSRDGRDGNKRGQRQNRGRQYKKDDSNEPELMEKVIKINRINKVVKGGKRLGFRAFVIAGNMQGQVGLGLGKSKEVPSAIKKAVDKAKKYQTPVILVNGTIPHRVEAKFGASKVMIRPAKDGTGVIAGGAVKILLEAAGLKNVVAKTFGSRNPFNAARAALDALMQCKDLKAEELKRGKKLPVYVSKTTESQKEAVIK